MMSNILEWLEFVFNTRKHLEETQPLEVYDDYQVANQLMRQFLDKGRF